MPEVCADDDTIQRFVVMHYRYDPDRHERRNVAVAAFDNDAEFQARISALAAALRLRKECNQGSDPNERIWGVALAPDHAALQRNARLVQRAIKHGVAL